MKIQYSSFLKGAIFISSGTALSQLIMIVATPILTRLYSPDEFGLYSAYLSVFSIFSVLVCGRYEQAIPVTKTNSGAINLLILSLAFSIFFSIFFFVTASLSISIFDFFKVRDLDLLRYSLFAALATFFFSVYLVLEFYAVRKKRYFDIVLSKNLRALSLTSGQASVGLIEGHWVGQLLGCLKFLQNFKLDLRDSIKRISRKRLVWAIKRYKRFPKYDVPAVLISVAGAQAPILFFIYFYSSEFAGYFLIALSLLSAPVGLLGKAISQSLLTYSRANAHSSRELNDVYKKTYRLLSKISFVPFFILISLPNDFFVVLLGEGWGKSGFFITWTAIWVMFQLVFSPLSVLFSVKEAQNQHRNLQVTFLIIRMMALIIPLLLGLSPKLSFIIFSLSSVICYLIGIIVIFRFFDDDFYMLIVHLLFDFFCGAVLFLVLYAASVFYMFYFVALLLLSFWLWRSYKGIGFA